MTRLFRPRRPGVDYTESSVEWPVDFKEAVLKQAMDQPWRLYPVSQPDRARSRMAELLGIDVERIRFTSGADGAVDLVTRFLPAASSLYIPSPAYPGYRLAAARNRCATHEYQAVLDVERIRTLVDVRPAHVILTWPGNPIGMDSLPVPLASDQVSWTVDATYLSIFSNEFSALVARSESQYNVIFSCSKTEGLAGVRLGGIVLATHDPGYTAEESPFALNTLQLAAAEVLLSPAWRGRAIARHDHMRREHARLTDALTTLGWVSVPSSALSFITVLDPTDSWGIADRQTYAALHAKRFADDGFLRITSCDHNITHLSSVHPVGPAA
ncbi:Histidinol-phosphate/aromatic aminotransferase or cobyric acid decarboxylase [Plantibacter sp. VKM Ac-1784]|uniref:histidinol-phosphate transaminase n=1 Tax=Plantibacter elymi (nom. nud.) TaxID=199708 RepID=A0ABY1RGX0_9MICO|nr:aminotransferase class I/II-fold pyridoxal phosphate-dependent enzyme [Plantibacter sp. VKM Ac-1784]SMQ73943.1 Histidinol-phosphate/aromatic aminotransferase or cobyric acid decarboxylase [Plantibacter sp. VKM Ac-1784]